MADVADGRLRSDAGTGPSLHCAGERSGPRLWPEALHDGDAKALWRARSPPGGSRIRRRRSIGCRLCDPRLGLAARAPQGVFLGFPPCRPLVRRDDGAPGRQARHGSKAGLSSPSPACGGGLGWGGPTRKPVRVVRAPTRRALSRAIAEASLRRSSLLGRPPKAAYAPPPPGEVRSANAPRPNCRRRGRRRAAAPRAAPPGMARPASRAAPPATSRLLRRRAPQRSVRRAPAAASAPRVSSAPAHLAAGSWLGG